jgi:hypothetical protein
VLIPGNGAAIWQVVDPNLKQNLNVWSGFYFNEGKTVASFCCQVAALVPGMFCYFYVMKNHKIANNSTTTEPLKLEKK